MATPKRRRPAAAGAAPKKKVLKKKAVVKKKAAPKKKAAKVATPAGKWPKFRNVAYEPYAEKQNIGNLAKQLIMAGKDTEGVIEGVLKARSDSKVSASHVSYYRQALTKEGYALSE